MPRPHQSQNEGLGEPRSCAPGIVLVGAVLHVWTIMTIANGRLTFRTKANGRFGPHLLCFFPCWAGKENIFPLGEAVAHALLAVRRHRDGERRPRAATPHDSSFDPLGGGPEYRGEWRMHHADVLSIFNKSLEA